MNARDVVDFWFSDAVRKRWWRKNPEFDREIRERFMDTYRQAVAGELSAWRETPLGRLAEIIVLDQFSRNMFRDQPEAFEYDHLARQATREAVAEKADRHLETAQKSFLYMPLMHSESLADHELAVQLFSSDPELSGSLEFEYKHKAIIERFGRYPHRNEVLGRESTEEEIIFLQQPGSSF